MVYLAIKDEKRKEAEVNVKRWLQKIRIPTNDASDSCPNVSSPLFVILDDDCFDESGLIIAKK